MILAAYRTLHSSTPPRQKMTAQHYLFSLNHCLTSCNKVHLHMHLENICISKPKSAQYPLIASSILAESFTYTVSNREHDCTVHSYMSTQWK